MKRTLAIALALAACKSPAPTGSSAPSASASAAVAEAPAARPAHSGPKKDHPEPEAKVAVAGGDPTPTGEPTESPKSVGLPAVDFGPAGALEIKGYPDPLDTGMRDFATLIGWTKDGSDVLACGQMTPLGQAKGAELADTCYSQKRGATTTARSGVDGGGDAPHASAALLADIALLKAAVRSDLRRDEKQMKLFPPALKTTWGFAKDLVVVVDGNGNALRVGGNVRGEDPVHPVTLSVKSKVPDLQYSGLWNAIVASPDASELAFVGHFYCMEWCNDVVISRMTTNKLASLVYNDTGFRHHQKKDYTGSRDLFLKATWADPHAPLPPYNLACAYALLGDETNAEKALRLAIAVGGDKVKTRAQKDSDFAKVRTAKWFEKLTS